MANIHKLAVVAVSAATAIAGTAAVLPAAATGRSVAVAPSRSNAVKWVNGHPDVKGQSISIENIGGPDLTQLSQYWTLRELRSWGVNINFNWASTTGNASAALVSGRTQVMMGSLPNILPGVENGLHADIFALTDPRLDYAFVSRAPIKTIADLRGKNIGGGNCSTSELVYPLAKQALASGGLTEKDISCVPTGDQSNRIAALLGGRIDASVLSHNALVLLKQYGVHDLFDFSLKDPNLYNDVAWASPAWLQAHPALAEAIVAAYFDFFRWFSNPRNASAAVEMGVKNTQGATSADARQLYAIYRKDNVYPSTAALTTRALQSQNALYFRTGVLPAKWSVNRWATLKYNDAVAAQLSPTKG